MNKPAEGAVGWSSQVNTNWTTIEGWNISSPSNGNLVLSNAAGDSFGRLSFGGTSASYPSMSRLGASLLVQLADGSGSAIIRGGGYQNTAFVIG